MRILLVGNPAAQSGKNAERLVKAQTLIEEHGATCEVFPTRPRGETIPVLIERLDRGGEDFVVAMGGDGTFREVAASILDSRHRANITMGMLPTGTANDQGRSFGLDADPAALARNVEVLFGRHEVGLDAGRLSMFNDTGALTKKTAFFDSFGWGLSARVLRVRNQDRAVVDKLGPLRELYRDFAVYGGAFVKTFLASYVEDHKFSATITTRTGESHELFGMTDLIVKNTRIYAGAWVLDPSSRPDDGEFEVVPFAGRSDWASKAILHIEGNPLTEEMLNTIGVSHSKSFRASTMRVTLDSYGDELVPAQIDGEEIDSAAVYEIEVVKQAIRLVVPRPAAPDE
ncbi:MAG: diacylglycerol kinase family protein [Polyangiaceae bacterium]